MDPFFDETNSLGYTVEASALKSKELHESPVKTSRSSFFKYKYVLLAVISFIIILVVTVMYFNNEYNMVKQWDNLVYPGVTINGKSYMGLTKQELIKSLNEEFGNQMSTKTITIKSNGQSNTISFSKLNPNFNTEEVAGSAINFMKNKDFFTKVNQIIGKKKETLVLTLKYNFNLDELKKFVDKTAEAIKKQPQDASIKIEDNSIKITDEVNGQTLKTEELFNVLKSKIEEFNNNNIELDAIVDTTTPKVTREILSKINGKLSESVLYKYQYNYDASILSNIQAVSNKLNGVLIYPNENFSFNELIGDPILSSNYKLLTKTVNGAVKENYFGISETAAVLFDAILRAGIVPTERCKSSEPVDYVSYGMEAIIIYNRDDLKFTNKYKSPVYIESNVENGTLTISIYSDILELEGKTYAPVIKDVTKNDSSSKNIIYIDDDTLNYGDEIVVQTALPRKEVEVYLQTKDQNNKIVEEQLYKQIYNGRPEKKRKGTKVADTINSTDQSNVTNNTSVNSTIGLNTTASKVPKVVIKNAR